MWYTVLLLLLKYILIKYIYPMMLQCWASVTDSGPALNQHWMFTMGSRSGLCAAFVNLNNNGSSISLHCPIFALNGQLHFLNNLINSLSSLIANFVFTVT